MNRHTRAHEVGGAQKLREAQPKLKPACGRVYGTVC
jgi:hypothetical protein